MKKLALSAVLLMVAGVGVSVGGVGCSSSSSTAGPGDDSGTPDVTAPEDGGSDTGTPTGDSSTPPEDTGTPSEAGPTCVTDAAVIIGMDTDAGFVPNTTCDTCIATNCGVQACPCLTDTNIVPINDAGDVTTGCGVYVGCVYDALAAALAADPDAGLAGLANALPTAESTCSSAPGVNAGSAASGKALVTCVAAQCATSCL